MFGRIMAVVVAVIVLLTSVLSGLGLYTLTSRQTAIRQENLRAEAREIAYLASLYSGGSSTYTLGTSLFSGSAQNTVALKHLRWKAAQVYDEYGAYIAIVDRSGQVMDNMAVTYEQNPDFAKTLNGKDVYEALLTIIGGDEIGIRRQVDGDWYFTVGVPFVSTDLGALLLHHAVHGGDTDQRRDQKEEDGKNVGDSIDDGGVVIKAGIADIGIPAQ